MWYNPLDESRAAGSNSIRLRRPSVSPVRLLRPWHGHLRSEPLSFVLEPSHLHIPRYLAIVCRSITCGFLPLCVRYLEEGVRANLRTPYLLVSQMECGSCYRRVGMNRFQRDPLPGSCTTIFAQLPSLGYHLQRHVPPPGAGLSVLVPRVRIGLRFRGRSSRVRRVWYSD